MIGNSSFSQFEDPSLANPQSTQDSKSNITSTSKQNYIKSSSHFQITDLDNTNPLMKLSNSNESADDNLSVIDGNIYQTKWSNLVGTDLIFDDYGELIGCVREHLSCDENVKISSKNEKDKKEDNSDDEDDVKEKEEKTSFLLKAMKTAKKKQPGI